LVGDGSSARVIGVVGPAGGVAAAGAAAATFAAGAVAFAGVLAGFEQPASAASARTISMERMRAPDSFAVPA
jgi:hypothetical protein